LNFLIAALVNLSRLETGIIAVTPTPEPVNKLLDQVGKQIKPYADAKQISLEIEDTPHQACYDLKWGCEALYNILDNAVKYTPDGGQICINVNAYEMFCRIAITDTGIGIAEEEHGRIFQRFYRSPAVATKEGVGIGLFLSRQIITAMGGYIKVTSQLGEGSVFSVFLPVKK
jgi:signal transduction histidine kinase